NVQQRRHQRVGVEEPPLRRERRLLAALLPPSIDAVNDREDASRHHRCSEKSVCEAAMVGEVFDAAEGEECDVNVWEFRRERERQRREPGLAVKTGAAERGAKENVGDGIHYFSLALIANLSSTTISTTLYGLPAPATNGCFPPTSL